MPSDKVAAATIAAAVSTILVWALKTYAHLDVPESVSGALVVLLTLLVGYVTPETNPAPSAIATVRREGLGG